MNPTRSSGLRPTIFIGVLFFAAAAAAQDTAPASIAGKTAVAVISSGSGAFAPIGGFRISFSATASTYTISPLSTTVSPSAGTYTYVKSSANSARILLNDTAVGLSLTQALVFTSTSTASYSVANALGNQAGTLVFEAATTTGSGSAVGLPLYPVNMSLLGEIGSTALTVGFVISSPDGGAGSTTSRFLIRAVGPGLSVFGVGRTAEAPRLTVNTRPSRTVSDWSATAENRTAVIDANGKSGAFALQVGSRDAAVVVDLPPGEVTISVDAVPGTRPGQAIIEVYRVP